jgi:hypothetical protein
MIIRNKNYNRFIYSAAKKIKIIKQDVFTGINMASEDVSQNNVFGSDVLNSIRSYADVSISNSEVMF